MNSPPSLPLSSPPSGLSPVAAPSSSSSTTSTNTDTTPTTSNIASTANPPSSTPLLSSAILSSSGNIPSSFPHSVPVVAARKQPLYFGLSCSPSSTSPLSTPPISYSDSEDYLDEDHEQEPRHPRQSLASSPSSSPHIVGTTSTSSSRSSSGSSGSFITGASASTSISATGSINTPLFRQYQQHQQPPPQHQLYYHQPTSPLATHSNTAAPLTATTPITATASTHSLTSAQHTMQTSSTSSPSSAALSASLNHLNRTAAVGILSKQKKIGISAPAPNTATSGSLPGSRAGSNIASAGSSPLSTTPLSSSDCPIPVPGAGAPTTTVTFHTGWPGTSPASPASSLSSGSSSSPGTSLFSRQMNNSTTASATNNSHTSNLPITASSPQSLSPSYPSSSSSSTSSSPSFIHRRADRSTSFSKTTPPPPLSFKRTAIGSVSASVSTSSPLSILSTSASKQPAPPPSSTTSPSPIQMSHSSPIPTHPAVAAAGAVAVAAVAASSSSSSPSGAGGVGGSSITTTTVTIPGNSSVAPTLSFKPSPHTPSPSLSTDNNINQTLATFNKRQVDSQLSDSIISLSLYSPHNIQMALGQHAAERPKISSIETSCHEPISSSPLALSQTISSAPPSHLTNPCPKSTAAEPTQEGQNSSLETKEEAAEEDQEADDEQELQPPKNSPISHTEDSELPDNDSEKDNEDLQDASHENQNIVLELSLDGTVRYLSANWEDITGYPASDLINTNISSVIIGDEYDREVFVRAAQAMKDDESSYRVTFLTSKRPAPICFDPPGTNSSATSTSTSNHKLPSFSLPDASTSTVSGSQQQDESIDGGLPTATLKEEKDASTNCSLASPISLGYHLKQADAVAAVAAAVLSPTLDADPQENNLVHSTATTPASLNPSSADQKAPKSSSSSSSSSPSTATSIEGKMDIDEPTDNPLEESEESLHNDTVEIHPKGLNIVHPSNETAIHDEEDEDEEIDDVIEIEGQGVLFYHKISGDASHTMWILRPYVPPKPLSIGLPWKLIQALGFGVDILVDYLQSVSEAVFSGCEKAPDPPTALCRICEHYFPTWWFERHSELCLLEHKAQSDIDTAHENLIDQRNTISQLLTLMDQHLMMAASAPAPGVTTPSSLNSVQSLSLHPSSSSSSSSSPPASSSASAPGSGSTATASPSETQSQPQLHHASPPSAFSSSSSLASTASNGSMSSASHKKIEYQGYQLPIFAEVFQPSSTPSFNLPLSSSPSSASPPQSSSSSSLLAPTSAFSSSPPMSPRAHPGAPSKTRMLAKQLTKQQRQPLKLLELLLGLCDIAVDINKPEIRYYNESDDPSSIHRSVVFNPSSGPSSSYSSSLSSNNNQTMRIHSPHSESNIFRVLRWKSPTIEDPGLQLLCKDTTKYALEKAEAVLRLGNTIKYTDTIRKELETTVLEVINDTVEKARQRQMDCACDMDLIEEDHDAADDSDYMSIVESNPGTTTSSTAAASASALPSGETATESRPYYDDETDLEEGSLFSDSYLNTDAIPLSATSSRSSGRSASIRSNRQNSFESSSSSRGRSRNTSSTGGSVVNVPISRRISTVRSNSGLGSSTSDLLGLTPPMPMQTIVTSSGSVIIPNASNNATVTPKAILASPYPSSNSSNSGSSTHLAFHHPHHPHHPAHHRLSTGSNDSIDPRTRIERRPTLDSPILDSPLEDIDLTNPLNNLLSTHTHHHSIPISASPSAQSNFTRIKSRKSLSNISTIHNSPSSYSSSLTSLQRNRIPVTPSSDSIHSPSTPLSSPLLFPSDHGLAPGPIDMQRRQSLTLSASDFQRQPISPLLTASAPPSKPSQPSIRDYEIINPISRGAFGSVFLARKKLTGEYFAIKVLKKADMVAKNQVKNVRAERAIMMSQSESPFVAKLYFTFQNKNYLYLVMEYLNGGDCAALVKALGGLPEEWAKKYCAEVVVGVQDLHEKGVIHRDLKPDNLLIDKHGHLKLTDFGLSRMGLVGRHTRQNLSTTPSSSTSSTAAVNSVATGATPTTSDTEGGPGSNDMMPPPPLQTHVSSLASALANSNASSGLGLGLGSLPNTGSTSSLALSSRIESKPLTKSNTTPEASSASTRPGSASSANSLMDNFIQDSSISLVPGYFNYSTPTGSSSYKFKKPPLTRSESNSSTTGEALFIGSTMFGDNRFPPEDDSMPTGPAADIVRRDSGTESPTNNPSAKPMPLFDPTNTTFKFVGTPDYLAPETIRGVGQDEMSDWWSLGCILFEFIYGYPPFHAETPELVFENILNNNLQWPSDEDMAEIGFEVSPEAKDLVSKLLNPDPNARIGAKNGAEEIKQHPFFKGINWDTLWDEDASFVPVTENPESTDYFDPRGAENQDIPQDMLGPDDDDDETGAHHHEGDENDHDDDLSGDVTMSSSAVSSGGSSRTGSLGSGHNFVFPAKDSQSSSSSSQSQPQQSQPQPRSKTNYPMPIPPHIRENWIRRASGTIADDFGNFSFKNLQVLDKANRDTVDKIKTESLEHRTILEAAEKKRARGLSISAPKRPLSPSISTGSTAGMSSGSSSRMPSPVRQTFSSPSVAMQTSMSMHSPMPSGSSVSSSLLSSSPSSSSSTMSSFSPHRKVYPTNSHHSRPSMSGISTAFVPSSPKSSYMSPSNDSAYLSQQQPPTISNGNKMPMSPQAPLFVGGNSSLLPPNREGSPDLSELRRHSSIRLTQNFDPSPSSSDNEETALQRVQKRRQISRRGVKTAVPAYRPLDVLLCDDNPVSRYTMQTFLRQLGCFVVATSSTAEAIRCAMGAVKYDIIFTEYRFEKNTGADFIRVLRNTASTNTNTPVVAVTSYVQEASPMSQPFSSVIEKPPTLLKFVKALERHCAWKPRSASINIRSAAEAVAEIAARSNSGADSNPSQTSAQSSRAGSGAGAVLSAGSSVSSSAITSASSSGANSNSASISAPSTKTSSSDSDPATEAAATTSAVYLPQGSQPRSVSASSSVSSISSASLASAPVQIPLPHTSAAITQQQPLSSAAAQPLPLPIPLAPHNEPIQRRISVDQYSDLPLPMPRQRGHPANHNGNAISSQSLKNARINKNPPSHSAGSTSSAGSLSSSSSSVQQQGSGGSKVGSFPPQNTSEGSDSGI